MDDEETVTVYVCPECLTTFDEWTIDTSGNGEKRTCACGLCQWVRLEGRALDLGIVRDES